MIERPIDEEPPIAETEAAEESKPAPKRGRRKKAVTEAAVAVAEPAPAATPAAETAEDSTPAEKPARKRRSKKTAAEPADAAAEPIPVPAANNDTVEEGSDEPRRSGWWQRTFG